ncbi:adult-specific cuticular protein ACP-20-like [Scylla paramamosain]|uniref:adult-specific cuticular protein ACP-20-like n=1 Tax=Scylla paramamosain TaxID=85552 RepID=UPI0030826C2C
MGCYSLVTLAVLASLSLSTALPSPQSATRGRPHIPLTPSKPYNPEAGPGITHAALNVPQGLQGFQSLGVAPKQNLDSGSGFKEFNAFSASNRGGHGGGGVPGGFQSFPGAAGGHGGAVGGGGVGYGGGKPGGSPFNHKKPNGPQDYSFPIQPHTFGYTVHDPYFGDSHQHQEVSDGTTTKGEYRVALPDGRTQIVTYSADSSTGFNAQVTYEGEAKPYVPQDSSKGGYGGQGAQAAPHGGQKYGGSGGAAYGGGSSGGAGYSGGGVGYVR